MWLLTVEEPVPVVDSERSFPPATEVRPLTEVGPLKAMLLPVRLSAPGVVLPLVAGGAAIVLVTSPPAPVTVSVPPTFSAPAAFTAPLATRPATVRFPFASTPICAVLPFPASDSAGVVPDVLPSVKAEKFAAPAVKVLDTARLRTVRAPLASTPSDSVWPFSVRARGGLVPFGFDRPSERLLSVRFCRLRFEKFGPSR